MPLTPQQAARRALAAAGPTTSVRAGPTTTVAGQDAYQLVIAPRDSRSLVGSVVIALDAQHPGVALRVQVFARAATAPAFQVGYTAISFGAPPASIFSFTPPPGSHVHTVTPPRPHAGLSRETVPKNMPAGWTGYAPIPPPASAPRVIAGAPRVIGSGWLSVLVLPGSVLSGLSHAGSAAGALGQAARSAAHGPGGGMTGGDSAAILAALLRSATPVHGAWGSGRLLRTSLVSVLITSGGHVLIGAVAPPVLYGAAGLVR